MTSRTALLWRGFAAAALCLAAFWPPVSASAAEHDALLQRINLPPGFKISVFARVPGARSLTVCEPDNRIFVGSRRSRIHELQGGAARQVASGLHVPNGIACREGRLYIALQDRIVHGALPPEGEGSFGSLETIKDDLPDKSHHGWRYAGFGPDDKLYVAIGSPCNICETRGLEGSIIRLNPDGSGLETVATGVRNSVGFDWHPGTGEMFFTDNGADSMGDDIPPDELNHVKEIGAFYGFPYLGGRSVELTGFEGREPPEEQVAPVIEFQAHVAALGIHFYRGTMFPEEYRGDAFVAQHGSWDRSEPVGYRIVRVRFDENGEAVDEEVFADGWLMGRDVAGRPVDIAELPDGSLIVSDDYANVVYRISYGE